VEDRPGARDRQHDRHEALGAHAAHRPARHLADERGGRPQGCLQPRASLLARATCLFDSKQLADSSSASRFRQVNGYGAEVGAAIASHQKILKVAFTGSTLVGRTIMKLAAESNLKNVTLELGGKSPNIVFEDADLDEAVSWAAFGINFNAGQTCCAGSRLYLQESIKEKFLEKLVAKFKEIQVGDPSKATTFQGPQVSQTQFDRISAYIQSGKDEGATLLVGGERHGDEGYFIQPTLFADVKPEMKILKEEIFGPVLVVATFKDDADVIAQANSSEYGLASAVFSKDVCSLSPPSLSLCATDSLPWSPLCRSSVQSLLHTRSTLEQSGSINITLLVNQLSGHGTMSIAVPVQKMLTRKLLRPPAPHAGAVWRLQDVGHRPRARRVRPPQLHQRQGRPHQPHQQGPALSNVECPFRVAAPGPLPFTITPSSSLLPWPLVSVSAR
jgi:hypothetical protein